MEHLGIRILFQGNNFLRLLGGLWVSLRIAGISMILSIFLGILMGLIMTSKKRTIRVISRLYLEVVRIMPPLVLLFLVYFGAAKHWNVNLSGDMAAVVVFTFWGTAEMGDLVRSGLESIPVHQFHSGLGLGMTQNQVYRYILIPQIFKRLLPSVMNLLTRMIKTTSLVVLIGVVEVVKVGKQMIDASRFAIPDGALWVYGAIFILYFAVCYPFSRASALFEKKLRD